MVMDPTFLEGLPPGADGERVKEFIAGACGVVCLELTIGAGTITGQVIRQDGEPVEAARNIYVRGIAAAGVTFGVTSGTLVVDGLLNGMVFTTTPTGAFALSAVAVAPAAALLCPDGGESRVVALA